MSMLDQTLAAPFVQVPVNWWMTLISTDQPARRLAMSAASALIGRSATCAIHVDHPSVSREHARLERIGQSQWRITDLGSHNGTLVNGKKIKSTALGHGDKIAIGPFTLILEMAGATVGLSDEISVVRTLGQMSAPRLALEQLNHLNDFGQLVLETADAAARRVALCRLLLLPEFGARWAIVVCVQSGGAPVPLCMPQSLAGDEPILSRTLISAVVAGDEPMMATNSPAGGLPASAPLRNLELSIAPEVNALTAVAVPLSSRADQTVTLLCAGFPPRYATSEWLALCGLAGRQYRQAESVWTHLAARQKLLQLEVELERARRVQARLVPQTCQIPGLDVAIRFRPCHEVGGDYVDILPLADGHALVVIADVSGKGLAAAMVAMGLHTVAHGCARRWAGLADLAAALDAHLVDSLSPETFVTLIALTIDPTTGAIEIINAGHPPAVVFTADGHHRGIGSEGGFVLGPTTQTLEVQHHNLAAAESLLLFTDGCIEVFNPAGLMLGTNGLCTQSALPIAAAPDASAAADAVAQLLDQWQGSAQAGDDRTLLLLRRRR